MSHSMKYGSVCSGIEAATKALNAHPGGSRRIDVESETFVANTTGPIQASGKAAGSTTQQDAESDLLIVHTLRGEGHDASEDGTGRGVPLVASTLTSGSGTKAGHNARSGHAKDGTLISEKVLGFHHNARPSEQKIEENLSGPLTRGQQPAVAFTHEATPKVREEKAYALDSQNGRRGSVCVGGMRVRRLTPRECERLQGFPDDYTLIPYRKKMPADGPRYKALGNSMAVPVMAWIGKRIQQVAE